MELTKAYVFKVTDQHQTCGHRVRQVDQLPRRPLADDPGRQLPENDPVGEQGSTQAQRERQEVAEDKERVEPDHHGRRPDSPAPTANVGLKPLCG